MSEATYTATDNFGEATVDGAVVRYRWWIGDNLSPLPDAEPPRFPRRLAYQGRQDGGWLTLGDQGRYGPCGCCQTRPCLPQCPLQTRPAPRPDHWQRRWEATARAMVERGQEVSAPYQHLLTEAR